jgi:hypothetical protein
MKTLKAIKATKHVEVGTIKRVSEKEADSDVRGGYWKYVPKSEWKSETRKQKPTEENSTETETKKQTSKTKKNVKKNS